MRYIFPERVPASWARAADQHGIDPEYRSGLYYLPTQNPFVAPDIVREGFIPADQAQRTGPTQVLGDYSLGWWGKTKWKQPSDVLVFQIPNADNKVFKIPKAYQGKGAISVKDIPDSANVYYKTRIGFTKGNDELMKAQAKILTFPSFWKLFPEYYGRWLEIEFKEEEDTDWIKEVFGGGFCREDDDGNAECFAPTKGSELFGTINFVEVTGSMWANHQMKTAEVGGEDWELTGKFPIKENKFYQMTLGEYREMVKDRENLDKLFYLAWREYLHVMSTQADSPVKEKEYINGLLKKTKLDNIAPPIFIITEPKIESFGVSGSKGTGVVLHAGTGKPKPGAKSPITAKELKENANIVPSRKKKKGAKPGATNWIPWLMAGFAGVVILGIAFKMKTKEEEQED